MVKHLSVQRVVNIVLFLVFAFFDAKSCTVTVNPPPQNNASSGTGINTNQSFAYSGQSSGEVNCVRVLAHDAHLRNEVSISPPDMKPGTAIDFYAQKYGKCLQHGSVEEFTYALHDVALLESNYGDPNIPGDNGQSIGLFQNKLTGGRASFLLEEGLSWDFAVQLLKKPAYNAEISIIDLAYHYEQAKIQNISGAQVAWYLQRNGQVGLTNNRLTTCWGFKVADEYANHPIC